MKFIAILLFILSVTAMAAKDPATSIYNGLKYRTLNTAEVASSTWLDSIEDVLERRHDFHENVSYVGEDWDEVTSFCNWSSTEAEIYFNDSEVYASVVWNKIVNKKGQTKAYVLFLFADIHDCKYPRGAYIIGRDGKEINTERLWNLQDVDLNTYIQDFVIK